MVRTRRLHARLAYVMHVENRASIAYAAASARSVRRGLLSPEVLMRSGCASHAWLTLCTIRLLVAAAYAPGRASLSSKCLLPPPMPC